VIMEPLPITASNISNPFPGLRPFDTNEKDIFFGRDGLSDTLLEKLHTNRFVAVVGTSGSGKSSLVRAGLLPTLRSGFTDAGSRWHVAMFRPINNPIHNLAIALSESTLPFRDARQKNVAAIEKTLRHSSLGLLELIREAELGPYENLLIVADQFEELYRFEISPEVEQPKEEASAFVRLLLEATSQTDLPIYVMLTMRSDYLGDSAQFWGLPEGINRGQFLIPRMDDDEKREAIEGPVRVFDAKISPALVSRLLNDLGDDPRQLPILQHALMRTWDYWKINHKESQPICIQDYDNKTVGGMKHALSIHADEAFADLTEEQEPIAQKIFKRLTEKGVGKREGRLPATVRELADIAETNETEVINVIEVFRKEGRSFLMPPAPKPLAHDTLIDISHESLISGWTKLSGWVDEEALSARIYQRLVDFALTYPNHFMTHPQLGLTLKWRRDNQPNEAWGRRYRTEFGKALDEYRERRRAGLTAEMPPSLPDWAEADDSEFAIAMRYLDRSQQKLFAAKRSKTMKRRLAFAAVAGVAFLFLVGTVIASSLATRFRALQLESDGAKEQVTKERDNAQKAQQNSEVAQFIAEMEREQAIVDSFRADNERQTAQQLRRNAEVNARRAELAGMQRALFETLYFGSDTVDQGNIGAILKEVNALKRTYMTTGDSEKAALLSLKIGSSIIDSDLDSQPALTLYKSVLELSPERRAKIDPSTLIKMGDSIVDSPDLDNTEAIRFYQEAAEPRNNLPSRIHALVKLGQLYMDSDSAKEGNKTLEKAYSLAQVPDNIIRGNTLVEIADVYRETDNRRALWLYEDAEYAYNSELTRSPSFGALIGDGRALEGVGSMLETQGNRLQAHVKYEAAQRRYQSALHLGAKTEKDRADAEKQVRSLTARIRATAITPIVNVLSTAIAKGIDEAVKKYRDLKNNHAKEYDFSETDVNSFGYNLLRNKQVKESIEIFKLNAETYPDSYNTWDSLGEAYLAAGDKANAIENYEKSIKLNPDNLKGKEILKQLKGQ
jgi:tetratricopeptide (TPR) repeat protein/energy-coupling factor transporter ATP-binding protein EcfA2